jgi:hypothetical protein
MPNNLEGKTVLWKMDEEQVKLLNRLISLCPNHLIEGDPEVYNRTAYELQEFALAIFFDTLDPEDPEDE